MLEEPLYVTNLRNWCTLDLHLIFFISMNSWHDLKANNVSCLSNYLPKQYPDTKSNGMWISLYRNPILSLAHRSQTHGAEVDIAASELSMLGSPTLSLSSQ